MKPLGQKNVRSTSRFEASYENADLAAFTDFQNWRGLRFAGSMSGHNILEWPTGRFVERRDEGSATVVAPLWRPADDGARSAPAKDLS